MNLFFSTSLFIACLSVGCQSLTLSPPAVTPAPLPDPAIAKLSEAAQHASQSLNDLAEISLANTPPPPYYQPVDPRCYGMDNLVSIDWTGPVQSIVQKIANSADYTLQILGQAPTHPLFVHLSVKNKAMGEVLRDIGFQLQHQASIIVYPHRRIIELRYAKD